MFHPFLFEQIEEKDTFTPLAYFFLTKSQFLILFLSHLI